MSTLFLSNRIIEKPYQFHPPDSREHDPGFSNPRLRIQRGARAETSDAPLENPMVHRPQIPRPAPTSRRPRVLPRQRQHLVPLLTPASHRYNPAPPATKIHPRIAGIYTGSIYKDYGLLKNGFPAESVMNGSVLVVKTHEWGPSARRPFAKAILLVRAPAAAIQAEFNRQSGGHVGFASPERYKRTRGKCTPP